MKKLCVFLFVVVIILSVAGCQSRSLGSIGGADGSTNGILGDDKGNQYGNGKEPIKVVMVDGCLYYETNEDSYLHERPQTFDGTFKKTVSEQELPKNNDESNFEAKSKDFSGYQRGVQKDTIEIPIDSGWEVFKKINDNEKDLKNYKYIVKVEGDTQYTKDDAEYIVLTNDLNITANDVAEMESSSGSKNKLDIYVVERDLD